MSAPPQSPLFKRPAFRRSAGILALGCALLTPLPAARLSYQTSEPLPGPHDVANLVGAAQDRNNVGGDGFADGGGNDASTYLSGSDRPHQGQTFATGSNSAGYKLNAVWLRHAGYTANTIATWWRTPVGSAFTVRVTNPAAAGAAGFALATESVATTGVESGAPNALAPLAAATSANNGGGVWLRFAFDAPATLSPNTRYGFDVAAISPGLYFETLGIRDAAAGGNPYAAGSAYNGSTIGAADNTLNPLAGDRVFLVELAPADGTGPELTPPHPAPVTTVAPFPLERVRLLESRFKSNQELHRGGYLAWISPDRLLYPFRANAGLPQPAGVTHLGGWEGDGGFTAVRGHMAGHYLTAASKMYAATGDASYPPKITYLVAELKKCQDALAAREIAAGRVAGYLSGFPSSDFTTLETNPAGAPVPFYTIHKILAGLVDAHRHCATPQALDVAIAMADYHRWRINRLTAAQVEAMFRTDNGNTEEWGGINETLADIYRFSLARGDATPSRHLDFARVFHRDWFITPLVARHDQLAGLHANTHIPQVVGFAHVASFLPETDPDRARLYAAATNFWDLVHDRHWLVLGGNSYAEHFAAPGLETGLGGAALGVSTAETCNTHNMLRLTTGLFAHAPSAAYADYFEHALYNHILASLAPDTGLPTYFVPMVSGHFKTYSQPAGSSWCCTGTGIENTARYGEGIYFHRDDTLWVNLFIPSTLDWNERGLGVRLDTAFPESDTIRLTLACATPTAARLRLRIPGWIAAPATVAINGVPQSVPAVANTYAELDRIWADGDLVTLTLPMALRLDRSMDDPTQVSLFHGPILLAGELGAAGMPPSDQAPGQLDYQNIPRVAAPALLASSATDLAAWVRPAARPLTYLADSALPGASTRGEVLLRPFYDVHHTRYATYWKLVAPTAFSTWSGEAGTQTGWNTAANWDAPPAAGSALRFASAAGGPSTNNLAAGILLHGLVFPGGAGPFVLGGAPIALAGDLLNASTAAQRVDLPLELREGLPWSFDAATADLTLGGPLTGAGTIVKHGPHRLTLLAEAGFSGGLHVAAGEVCIGDGGVVGDLNSTPVTLATAGTALVFDRADTFDVNASVSGHGAFVKRGPGVLRLLSAATHGGETRVEAGTLRIESKTVPVLAHRWSFDGNLADSVGDSPATLVEVGTNNATLSATQLTLTGGDRNASDYVSLGEGLLPKDGRPVTLEFWATQVTRQNWGRIFDIGASASENLFMSWSRESLASDRVEWKDAAAATADDTCAPLALGTEYHLALVIEPGAGENGRTRVTWYAAPSASATLGAARGTFETNNTLADLDDAAFWLGRSHYNDPTASARYNEVRLWTRALATADLEQLHDLGAGSTGAFATRIVTGSLSPASTLRIASGAALDLGGTTQELAALAGAAGGVLRLGSGGRLVIRGGGDPAATFAGTITGSDGGILNEGTLRLTGAAAIPAGVTLTNRGVLDTMTWAGALPAGFVNEGVLLDRGAVRVETVSPAGGVFTLTIQGHSGHSYRLQYREDLATGDWIDLDEPRPGADAPISFSHAGESAASPRRFYRVLVD